MSCESERLAFIERRDGKLAAFTFADTTMRTYRRAVLYSRKRGHYKPHFVTLPDYKRKYIESYLAFKQYVLTFTHIQVHLH